MDGASAGVTGGSASWPAAPSVSLAAWLAVAAPAANAAALSAADVLAAAGSSGGWLRILMPWEAQPASAMTRMATADLISRLPASVRPAWRACPRFAAARRYCRDDRHGHRRQFSTRERLVTTPVPVYPV